MHWSGEVSDALAALRTLMLNREWDRYWQPEAFARVRIILRVREGHRE
jgi:hypothetical protein